MNDRQLGERLRRAFEAEPPPAISAAEILQRAEATQSKGHHADLQDRERPRTRVGRPALIPPWGQATLGAVALDREERQRRELEAIRRSFTEIGTRMGSLFEPAQEREAGGVGREEPVQPMKPAVKALPAGRWVPSWAAAAVVALVFLLLGGGLGYLLHRSAVGSAQPPVTIVVSDTVPETKLVAPSACLQTARLADQTIDLLIRNIRDRRLSSAFKAYTEASQACRKAASP